MSRVDPLTSLADLPPAVIWDGIAGAALSAVVGGLVSALVAWWVVRLTQRGAQRVELAHESHAAAAALTVGMLELRAKAGTLNDAPSEAHKGIRRDITTDAALLFNLNRPTLQSEPLRADMTRAQEAVLAFLRLSRDCDNAFPAWVDHTGRGLVHPSVVSWHIAAHAALGDYLATVTGRLEHYRRGEPVPTTPLPAPVWPPVPAAIEAT